MISVIITNYNGLSILKDCLDETYQTLKQAGISDIILADDASSDASVSYVQARFPDIIISRRNQNGGFSANCNTGASHAKAPLLLFLNNDMIVKKFDLKIAVSRFESPTLFATSASSQRHTPTGLIDETPSYGYFKAGYLTTRNGQRACDAPKNPVPILWGCGGALLVRKAYFEALNGFYTGFFIGYSEDLDLCYRAWKQGLITQYEPAIQCYHQHQSTFGVLFSNTQRDHLARTNAYIMTWRNLTDWSYIITHSLALVLRFLTLQLPHIRAILKASTRLPAILNFRKSVSPGLCDKAVLQRARPDYQATLTLCKLH